MRALFLDRDGVINKEVNYCHTIEDFEFLPDVFRVVKSFNDAGYKVIVITNQAGIAKGKFTLDDFHVLNGWMLDQFQRNSALIDAVYFCPHHQDGYGEYAIDCECRKPNPGMIISAKNEFRIDLSSSILVGDKIIDVKAGLSAGVGRNFLIRTGHAIDQSDEHIADGVLNSLAELLRYID